jgi:ketosteroid isomerase-like protein
MASANLELVRSILTATERGDYTSVEWADPEVEFVVVDGPTPGSWKGVAGMAEGIRSFLSTWEDYRVEAEEFRELNGERVLVLIRRSGRGKASGLELEQLRTKGANLFEIHGGKVTRVVAYWDHKQALADLGLKG